MPWTDAALARFWAKVDKDSSDCWLWTAAQDTKGYGQFYLGGTKQAHRLSYELTFGQLADSSVFLDHTCFVHHCVKPAHMRPTTNKQNQENRQGVPAHNRSGYRGVSPHGDKWQASVNHAGKAYYAGLHSTPELANEAATAKRLELFTHNDKDRSTV